LTTRIVEGMNPQPSPTATQGVTLSKIRHAACHVLVAAVAVVLTRPASAEASKWAASWATAIQSAYVAPTTPQGSAIPAYSPQPDLSFALPNATVRGISNQTLRMIIKPDLWSDTIRVRFSNFFGTRAVTFSAASVALQLYGANLVHNTSVRLTFNGYDSVTILPGQSVFSDPAFLPFAVADSLTREIHPYVEGRNLAVSFAVAGSTGPASYHEAAFNTSYISPPGSGNVTRSEDDTVFPYSTTSLFFVSELDVVAPANTLVICAFGDSITDGTASTLNGNDRWANVMSRTLHEKLGPYVSVVNEAIAGNAVAATVTGQPATRRVGRDVVGLSGINLVVWLEGINDFGAAGSTPAPVIAGYQQVVNALHAAGIKVIGATVTSSYPPGGMVPANSPLVAISPAIAAAYGSAQTDTYREQLNNFILTSGIYDGTADFSTATKDPTTGSLQAAFVPNSEGCAGDYLHPNRFGYQVMGSTAAEAVINLDKK